VGGAPQRVVEVLVRGLGPGQLLADAVEEPERGRLPEVGARTAFEQPAGGVPLTESDVVAAGRPVQRGLGMRTGEARVDVRAGGDERADLGAGLRDVPGPVGDDVQQRPRLSLLGVADPGGRKPGVLAKEPLQLCGLAGADDLGRPCAPADRPVSVAAGRR
jgi:hypothetical protein